MARWFWYLSPQKIETLKKPVKGWGFLKERFGSLEIQAGVPWAKLSSKAVADASVLRSLEAVEKEIMQDHEPPSVNEIGNDTPIFFTFTGEAGRIVLRESYRGQEGECVFLLIGIQNKTGVILLGSGANIVASASPRPRFVNPSVDPVGALLVLVDTESGTLGVDGYPRAGIARGASHLSLEERLLFSFAAAAIEIKQKTFLQRVHALAVFTRSISVDGRQTIDGLDIPDIEKLVIGSPVYVEQLGGGSSNVA